MIKYIKLVTLLFSLLIASSTYSQGIYLSAASGNWNNNTTWLEVVFFPSFSIGPATTSPNAGDQVNIQDGHTVTSTGAEACAILNMASTTNPSLLLVNSGASMTCDSITMNPNSTGACIVTNNGTVTTPKVNLITSSPNVSCTVNNNGTMTINNTTFTHTAGGASINLNGGSTYSTRNVNATNTSVAGTRIDMSSGNGVMRLTNNGGFNGSQITFAGGNSGSRIEYRGNSIQTITSSNPNFVFNEIRVLNTAGANFDAALPLTNINGDIRTAGSGIINQAGFAISTPTRVLVTANGTFNSNSDITTGTLIRNDGVFNKTAGNITVGTNLDNRGTFNQNSGNVVVGVDLVNRGIYNANGPVDINRHFNNTATGSYISTGSNINVARNWTNNGTYTYSTGDIVSLDGTGANSNFAGTTEFYELNVTKAGRRAVANDGDVINIRSILDVDAGDFRVTGTGSVTLLSDASGTAQLDELESGATFTGSLGVQRFLGLGNNGFREITSPIMGTTLANWQDDGIILTGYSGADFTGSNWFGWINTYTYDEPTAAGVKDNGWAPATSNTNSTGYLKGHRLYMGTGNYTMAVRGTPVTGIQSAPITNGGTGTDQNGWNLIGNPYPCTINWNSLATSNTDAAIWIWSGTAGNYGIYQTGAPSGTNGVDNRIAHSQAFWVHATAGSGSVIFQESNKIRDDKAFVKNSTNNEFVRIKLSGNVNSYYDEAIITFNNEATINFDEGIDQNKLYTELEDLAPSLAIRTNDNADLSIAGINQYKSITIPVKAFAGNNAHGVYSIEFDFPSNSLINSCITLEDLETGTITDLKNNPSYTFTTTSSSPEERFLIHITSPFETTVFEPTCASVTDGAISIEGTNVDGNTFTLSNANGMVQTIEGNGNQVIFEDLISGEYTITSTQSSSCGHNSITAFVSSPDEVIASFDLVSSIILEDNNTITPVNNSNGTNYTWDFGDGNTSIEENPSHTYSSPGIYTVTLTAELNGCENSQFQTVEVKTTTSVDELSNLDYSMISNDGSILINFENDLNEETDISITSMNGQNVYNSTTTSNSTTINSKEFAKGVYLVTIKGTSNSITDRVLVK